MHHLIAVQPDAQLQAISLQHETADADASGKPLGQTWAERWTAAHPPGSIVVEVVPIDDASAQLLHAELHRVYLDWNGSTLCGVMLDCGDAPSQRLDCATRIRRLA